MKIILPETLKRLMADEPDTVLIDVREQYEHQAFNIGGTLMPLGELMEHAGAIPTNRPVIIYCRKGIRSAIAIQKLEARFGMNNLVNLQGGLDAWDK